MKKKSLIENLPTEILEHIINYMSDSNLSYLSNLGQTNRFFNQITKNEYLKKAFIIKHILRIMKSIEIEGDEITVLNLNNLPLNILKDLLVLLVVSFNSIRYEYTLQVIEQLLNNALLLNDTKLNFMFKLAITRLYIDPDLPYKDTKSYFDNGFKFAQECYAVSKQNSIVCFVLAAYWRELFQRFSSELNILHQKYQTFFPVSMANSADIFSELGSLEQATKDCKKALNLSTEYVRLAINNIDINLCNIIVDQKNKGLVFSHPHADLFLKQIQKWHIQYGIESINNLLDGSNEILYELCFRKNHWLLNLDQTSLVEVMKMPKSKFQLLKPDSFKNNKNKMPEPTDNDLRGKRRKFNI